MVPETLRTTEDVKRTRRKLFDNQQGVDPILDQKIEFNESVMDHDHTTQNCRAAIHRQSNAFEGLVFNAYKRCLGWLTSKPLPDILRNLAGYLEEDYSENPYHPGWMKKFKTRFNKLNAEQQREFLTKFNQDIGKNSADRLKSLNKILKDKSNSYEVLNESISIYENN